MSVLYLTLVLMCTVLLEASSASNNKLIDTQWKMNSRLTRSFPCLEPQRRAVPLHELITQDDDDIYHIFGQNSSLHVVPESVVLYRCENSGCCAGRRKACSVQKEEPVTLTFKYYSMTNSEYVTISVSNHTKCGCSEIKTNNIK